MLVVFAWLPFVLDDTLEPWGRILLSVMFGGGALAIGLGLWEVYKARHIFSEGEVRYEGAFRRKAIPRYAIKGYRTDNNYVYVVPRTRQHPTIRIGYSSAGYTEIQRWLAARFPDLDVQQQQQDAAALLREEDFGRNEAEREASLLGARRVSWVLNTAGLLVGAGLFFWSQPPSQVLLAGLALSPLAAAVLFWHRGLISFGDGSNRARPGVLAALLFPTLSLLIQAFSDFELLAYQPLVPYAAGTALLLATALALGSPQQLAAHPRYVLLGAAVLGLLYGSAFAATFNCSFDHVPPRTYAVPVLGKQLGGGQTSSYYLKAGPWGLRPQPENVEVSSALYEQTAIGDTVHIYQRPGRLGAAWFTTGE